jgi:ribonuclease HI
MIEYYMDGSTKEHMIGVGIVKVNEFGFIEKHHFKVEHLNPNSHFAEGYALEKALEMIKLNDLNKNEMINLYTDSQSLYHSFLYNGNIEFNRSPFFVKQESNSYFQHLRNLYISLVWRNSNYPVYHCAKTNQARPLIKLFFKDDVEDKKFLQEAHSLSRYYIKVEAKPVSVEAKPMKVDAKPVSVKAKPMKVELKAVKEKDKWCIVKDNKDVIAENQRPLIALSEALKQTDAHIKQIKLCDGLKTILKNTNKNKLSKESMKTAIKIIEKHKLLI